MSIGIWGQIRSYLNAITLKKYFLYLLGFPFRLWIHLQIRNTKLHLLFITNTFEAFQFSVFCLYIKILKVLFVFL